jgi:hypothetical protein
VNSSGTLNNNNAYNGAYGFRLAWMASSPYDAKMRKTQPSQSRKINPNREIMKFWFNKNIINLLKSKLPIPRRFEKMAEVIHGGFLF